MTEYRTHLAGGKFCPAECQAQTISLDDSEILSLEREPENPYDPFAIKVMKEDFHLGYVPKTIAAELAQELDAGVDYECTAVGYESPLMPFLRITPVDEKYVFGVK